MAIDKNFMGYNGFVWFYGVVEDRNDPEYLGRVRVRAIGLHTDNKDKIATADLPWATVVLPVTSAGISGLGSSPAALLEGSWVFGYFRDGERCQEPVILGSVPGRPTVAADTSLGFNDPNGVYPKFTDEPDTNRLAVNNTDKEAASLTARKEARLTNIQGVNGTWSQPEIDYNAVYPYNKVYETENGHILEFDDTANAKRIHLRHANGSSIEMTENGDTIEITSNDRYILVTKDNKVYIKGTKDVVIDGDYNLKVNGNYNVEIAKNKSEIIGGTKTSTTEGAVVHIGKTIDLNP